MKNTGKKYEDLVEYAFRGLWEQNVTDTLEIQRNVTIAGKDGKHEIDICCKFQIGGINYITIIQAKDEKNKIKQNDILAFKSILNDIPGQPRGVFVTKTGYQSGALEIAKKNGILLYKFGPLTQQQHNELPLREINIKSEIFFSDFKITSLKINSEWAKNRLKELGYEKSQSLKYRIEKMTNEVNLYDLTGKVVGNAYELAHSKIPKENKVIPATEILCSFENPTFIDVIDFPLTRVLIDNITFTIKVDLVSSEVKVKAANIINFILQNLSDETSRGVQLNKKFLVKD